MDIQKEREAFEEYIISKHKNRSPLILTQRIQHGFSENYIVQGVQDCWETWQAVKAQAVPEGFVVVAKELPEKIAEKMAIDRIDKPIHENDPVWSEIAEESYKNQVKLKKWEFWRDYKAMIEAQEPTND